MDPRLKLQQQHALMQQTLLHQQQLYHSGVLAAASQQVPTLKTYKRKGSQLQDQLSSPKHGRPKGSPSSVPDALVPPDVHTKSLISVSSPVEPGIPEDLIHYTCASPSSIPTKRNSVVNLSQHAPPSTLLKPPMTISLPRRIIAQRERRAREKAAKANIQPIHGSRVVPGSPEGIMPLSSASMATPIELSSMMNSYKRKGFQLQEQLSSPKHGRPKGSTSSVPDALVPPDVHTRSLNSVSSPVEPVIPEDLIHYTRASPSSIPTKRTSVVNLSQHAPPSTLLKPPMTISLPRRIIAQRERRAREKAAKANIQPIHGQGCGQPSLATEALSSSSSSGLKSMTGKILCCEGRLESLQPGKEKKNGDQSEHLWLKIDARTPAVEKILPDAVKGLENPTIELVKGNEAEKMDHQSYPSHTGSSSRKTIPFVKRSVLWKSIESMETFHKMPQNPCFRQLEKLTEWSHEGAGIALMMNFDCLVRRIGKLCISDSQLSFNEMLQSLVTFEENGFDVGRIRSRIEELLEIRNNGNQFKEEKSTLQEQLSRNTDEESRLDTQNCSLEKTIMEVERQLASLCEERDSVYMQRMTIASETDKLQKDVKTAEKSYHSVEQRFNTIVASPW